MEFCLFGQIPYIWPFPQSLLLSQIFSQVVQDEILSAVVQMDIKHEYWSTSRKCCSQAIWKERLLEELIRGYNLFVIAEELIRFHYSSEALWVLSVLLKQPNM